ncbi:uncharacterized protein CTRU02_215000 [Colletotrichum truncatum]|uniref:Uncharacterized protein n=1 Tax=Colletotrichum truncatum TaxID=5467 RepID=A0ACC3YE97_COLTU
MSKLLRPTELLLLTCPSIGLQVCWFLLTSSGTVFLLSLGIPNFVISLVWVSGPLFGAFVQPIFGLLSDESQGRLGKRIPFIVGGATSATAFQLALAYARELTDWGVNVKLGDGNKGTDLWQTQVFAVICVLVITFALQAYAVGLRALIVDNCPPSQQVTAAAWAMRWNVLGNVILASFGFLDAQWSFFAGDATMRFKMLTIVAATCSSATVGLVCVFIPDSNAKIVRGCSSSFFQCCRDMFSLSLLTKQWAQLPRITRKVCMIQLFAWAGWFPILYYMSTTDSRVALLDNDGRTGQAIEKHDLALVENARKYSFFASFAFALGALFSSVLFGILERAIPTALKLPHVWLTSQCLLGLCMHLTFFSRSGTTAVIIVAMMGITAPVTMWIPFALISTEISEAFIGKPYEEVGRIMGLHNMAISLPQIGSTLVCAILLAVLKLLNVADSVAWVFRLASVAVFYSVYLIQKLC